MTTLLIGFAGGIVVKTLVPMRAGRRRPDPCRLAPDRAAHVWLMNRGIVILLFVMLVAVVLAAACIAPFATTEASGERREGRISKRSATSRPSPARSSGSASAARSAGTCAAPW